MSGFFKFLLYLGVIVGLAAAFAWPYVIEEPWMADVPPQTRMYLSYGGLGLIVIGLIGRSFFRTETHEWK